jgi:hypothetical protein
MNERWDVPAPCSGIAGEACLSADGIPAQQVPIPCTGKAKGQGPPKRDGLLTRDSVAIVKRDGIHHVITESYFYKTDAYYTILDHEMKGIPVEPSSGAVLDAYVVPICLEKASLAGIPVSEWGISHSFIPTPAVIYGLNYFATSAEYFVVVDAVSSKSVIKHITHNGKYPFCFQKLPDGAEIITCTAIFGKTVSVSGEAGVIAGQVYRTFRIPLVNIVLVKAGAQLRLSALTPTRYSKLNDGERSLLSAYLANQEFL